MLEVGPLKTELRFEDGVGDEDDVDDDDATVVVKAVMQWK